MKIRVEANINWSCNARCFGCNKGLGYFKNPVPDMTVENMRVAVDQLLDQEIEVKRFTFCGGEPILHKGLQEMIYEVSRLTSTGLQWGRVLTNGLNATKSLRDKIDIPPKFSWVENPLDDPDDPLSGKNDPTKRGNTRVHLPFWISPADIGEESTFEKCTIKGWCGIGLDSTGFSMCGKSVMLGKLFGIETAKWDCDIEKHVTTPINDICKHCQYGLGGIKGLKQRGPQYDIARKYWNGELEAISPTFEEAFKNHNEKTLVPLEV